MIWCLIVAYFHLVSSFTISSTTKFNSLTFLGNSQFNFNSKLYLKRDSDTDLNIKIKKKYSNNNDINDNTSEKGILSNNFPYSNAQVTNNFLFLTKAAVLGVLTGMSVVAFKSQIAAVSIFFYETMADALPKPVFYWPIVLFPLAGSLVVSILYSFAGPSLNRGINQIASNVADPNNDGFEWKSWVLRTIASVFTLGSGNSLGPEGPSVELGAGLSRLLTSEKLDDIFSDEEKGIKKTSDRDRQDLFLAGVAAGTAAGFDAPFTGILFSLECGNRYLSGLGVDSNTADNYANKGNRSPINLLGRNSPDGPRADVAAIVLAATGASLITGIGPREATLSVQGNSYAMISPLFELPLYLGLGVVCGVISVVFDQLKKVFVDAYDTVDIITDTFGSAGTINTDNKQGKLSNFPLAIRPLLGGLLCGAVGLFLPQTLFNSYATLDQLFTSGGASQDPLLLTQLLSSKLVLSAFCLASGLVGGVFAPSLFFGATAGGVYHEVVTYLVEALRHLISLGGESLEPLLYNINVADAPAYVTVGAAASLGAVFRAPLTASMLMFEITQNHDLVLPVLASAGVSGLVSEILSQPRNKW